MSKNIIETVELLFLSIKIRYAFAQVLPSDFDEKRTLIGDNDDAEWIKYRRLLNVVEIAEDRKFALFEHKEKFYFVAIGYGDPDLVPAGFIRIPVKAGLFASTIVDLDLPVLQTIGNNYIEQYILSQSEADPLYKGHNVADLQKIFPHIFIAEVSEDFGGDIQNLSQLSCLYLTCNKKFVMLPFTDTILNKLNELVSLNSKILNYDSILQALLSSQYKFAYLDLYRCIEMLYQLVYIDDAYSQIGLTIDKTTFLEAIDSKLSWRPNERNSIKKIIDQTPSNHLTSLKNTIKHFENTKSHVGEWVYDLRCNIVHLKSRHKSYNLKREKWNELIYGLTIVLIHWYTKYPDFN